MGGRLFELCLSQELDLAILSVDSEKFWSGLDPLPLRVDIPELDDNVTVVGNNSCKHFKKYRVHM